MTLFAIADSSLSSGSVGNQLPFLLAIYQPVALRWAASTQKRYFNANCICLGAPEVLVTLPPEATSTAPFGALK